MSTRAPTSIELNAEERELLREALTLLGQKAYSRSNSALERGSRETADKWDAKEIAADRLRTKLGGLR